MEECIEDLIDSLRNTKIIKISNFEKRILFFKTIGWIKENLIDLRKKMKIAPIVVLKILKEEIMKLLKTLKKKSALLVKTNILKYLLILLLTATAIIDVSMIAVCITGYALTGNAENLKNITTYALIISTAFTLNVYFIKKIK